MEQALGPVVGFHVGHVVVAGQLLGKGLLQRTGAVVSVDAVDARIGASDEGGWAFQKGGWEMFSGKREWKEGILRAAGGFSGVSWAWTPVRE